MRKNQGALRASSFEGDSIHLLQWCREFHRGASPQWNCLGRFMIGVNQIHQGLAWKSSASGDESYAAAAIHIIASVESLDVPIETQLPQSVEKISFGPMSAREMVILISKLSGQLIYGSLPVGVARRKRFDRDLTAQLAGELVRGLIGMIPEEKRNQSFYTAMQIMTGDL